MQHAQSEYNYEVTNQNNTHDMLNIAERFVTETNYSLRELVVQLKLGVALFIYFELISL